MFQISYFLIKYTFQPMLWARQYFLRFKCFKSALRFTDFIFKNRKKVFVRTPQACLRKHDIFFAMWSFCQQHRIDKFIFDYTLNFIIWTGKYYKCVKSADFKEFYHFGIAPGHIYIVGTHIIFCRTENTREGSETAGSFIHSFWTHATTKHMLIIRLIDTFSTNCVK